MSNQALIDITARLAEAAQQDERLEALAEQAKKILLADQSAMSELLQSYIDRQQNPSPFPGFTPTPQPTPAKQPTAEDQAQAAELLAAIMKQAKR